MSFINSKSDHCITHCGLNKMDYLYINQWYLCSLIHVCITWSKPVKIYAEGYLLILMKIFCVCSVRLLCKHFTGAMSVTIPQSVHATWNTHFRWALWNKGFGQPWLLLTKQQDDLRPDLTVSKPRETGLVLFNCSGLWQTICQSGIWQIFWLQTCRKSSQMSKKYNHPDTQSYGFNKDFIR